MKDNVKDPGFALYAPNGWAFIKCHYCEKEFFLWNRRTPPLCSKCMKNHCLDWAREYRKNNAKEAELWETAKSIK